jgi:hypothetical protein
MNIDEMRAEKELAEKQIQIAVENAVERFTAKTGLAPNCIDVKTRTMYDRDGDPFGFGYRVKLDVRL